jgi:release factor glutamine methyltransferase
MPIAIETALARAASQLSAVSSSPGLDAEVLLSRLLGKHRAHLRARPQDRLSPQQRQAFDDLVARRREGEPIAYITGRREFWSMEVHVTPATLIPRPETELVVEQALQRLPVEGAHRVADLGTGSGAIALAIARERPSCTVVATDISDAALHIARWNTARLKIANVEYHRSDWYQSLNGERFDVVCCNPPYVREGDPHLTRGDLTHEPTVALVAGESGMEAIRTVIAGAQRHLRPGGWLILEHGFDQADEVTRRLRQHGFEDIDSHHDIAGQARVAVGRAPA